MSVPTIDLAGWLQKRYCAADRVEIKMDIEGAEAECLCQTRTLENVEQMFVEYHSFEGEPQLLDEVLRKLKESGFRYYIQTQFCSPQPLVNPETNLEMDLQLNLFARRPRD